MKKKAAMIVAENLKAILVGYWRVLVLKTLHIETRNTNKKEFSIVVIRSKYAITSK